MIKIMICEDEREVREGLRYILDMEKDLSIMDAFESGEELLHAVENNCSPDIVLMDIELNGISGIETTRRLKDLCPDVKVLILTIFEEEGKIFSAIEAGATGYVLKNTRPGELVSQIKAMYSGGSPISPSVARVLLDEFKRDDHSEIGEEYKLTPREREIMQEIIDGYTYREIAEICNISASTVKKHILHIYRKLNVNSKVEFIKKVMGKEIP